MMLDFSNEVVLVTGASSGIGSAVACGFAELGASTVVHYNRNVDGANATMRSIRAVGGSAVMLPADLSEGAAAESLVDEVMRSFGRIDILVNNAGDLVKRAVIEELEHADFEQIMSLNLASVFSTCRRVLPGMRRAGGGSIVNLTSIAARTGGAGGSVAYAAAKAAVSTFTRGLAKEVAESGIRVNAVSPGVISTPLHERHTSDDQMRALRDGIPMKRAGTPEDCVGPVLFLASATMSGYVTGQIIEVNGGLLTP